MIMAVMRSSAYLKSMLSNRIRGAASTFSTSTSPKLQAYTPTIDLVKSPEVKSKAKRGDFVPVVVALGMILLSASFGIHTAMQQLRRSPNVHVNKSRRETIPEVVEPEHVVEESEKFIKKSFFRKVAHIQDPKRREVIPNPIRGDISARPPHVETLKDLGVDPKLQ